MTRPRLSCLDPPGHGAALRVNRASGPAMILHRNPQAPGFRELPEQPILCTVLALAALDAAIILFSPDQAGRDRLLLRTLLPAGFTD